MKNSINFTKTELKVLPKWLTTKLELFKAVRKPWAHYLTLKERLYLTDINYYFKIRSKSKRRKRHKTLIQYTVKNLCIKRTKKYKIKKPVLLRIKKIFRKEAELRVLFYRKLWSKFLYNKNNTATYCMLMGGVKRNHIKRPFVLNNIVRDSVKQRTNKQIIFYKHIVNTLNILNLKEKIVIRKEIKKYKDDGKDLFKQLEKKVKCLLKKDNDMIYFLKEASYIEFFRKNFKIYKTKAKFIIKFKDQKETNNDFVKNFLKTRTFAEIKPLIIGKLFLRLVKVIQKYVFLDYEVLFDYTEKK